MIILLTNQIEITEPTIEVKKWIKENLELSNPEFEKKKRMGFWTGNTPRTLKLYSTKTDSYDNTTYIVPYGCKYELENIAGMVLGNFPNYERIKYDGEVPLYDYQQVAIDELQQYSVGVLQSPPGSGKTQMGIALASTMQAKTLWLTHTKDLLNQSMERAKLYFPAGYFGSITDGKVNIGSRITFATVQTMSKLDLNLYRDTWECVIVDECHHCVGSPTTVTMYSKVLNNLRAPYKYGLSATVHRADGLINAMYALLGRVRALVPEEAVASRIIKAEIFPVNTYTTKSLEFLNTDGTVNYTQLINYLGRNVERNKLLVDYIVQDSSHSCLVLSDRVSHLKTMYEMLPTELQEVASVIDGKMTSKSKKAERTECLDEMRTGSKRILFATYALAKEGLDIPRLDRLFLTTPQKDYAVIAQSVGRVERVFEGKDTPIVYDFVDDIVMLQKSFRRRCSIYKKIGCEVA